MQDWYKCALCKDSFSGFGNNPWPLAEKGRCCDECNFLVVASRLNVHILKKEAVKDKGSCGWLIMNKKVATNDE